ncbi:MAG: chalcone isomerase family protein [Gammaproteobacteria bacterium]
MSKLKVFILLISVGFASAAFSATLAGVTIPDTATVDGKPLVLNGVALRTKTWFKVKIYVGGLYLPQKADTVEAVMSQAGPDRILMHMIYPASKDQFADAWNEGFTNNNSQMSAALQSQIVQFLAYFGKAKEGDEITLDYIPGTGTQVSWNGKLRGNIPGEDFHKALLNAFLGPKLPDDFRNGLLGKSS